MHTHSLERWHHAHVFLGERHDRRERRTWFVVALTAATMVAEVIGGTLFGSLAVVADGVHMSTHVAALAIAALAYRFARRHAADARFSFGTGKLADPAADRAPDRLRIGDTLRQPDRDQIRRGDRGRLHRARRQPDERVAVVG